MSRPSCSKISGPSRPVKEQEESRPSRGTWELAFSAAASRYPNMNSEKSTTIENERCGESENEAKEVA